MLTGLNESDTDWQTSMHQWFRSQIACYGAVIAIILQQLDSSPRTTITDSPNPLVRIDDRGIPEDDWHPDELIVGGAGRQYVLVWDGYSASSEVGTARVLSN